MGEHRVPLLGATWRRNEDPAASRDPRVRAVVGALATLPAPEMRADFRADLRAQLVAITPRIITESGGVVAARESGTATAELPMIDIVPRPDRPARPRPLPHGRPAAKATAPRHADGVLARLRGVHLGRPLTVAASVIVAFALLLGGAVVMSRKALPGDALYGLKRASERFELATAGSAVDKAKDHLDFAKNRAQEAQALARRLSGSALGGAHASGGGGGTSALIVSTLQAADGDVRAAAQLLGTDAVQHHSASPLRTMSSWAPAQAQRLQSLAGSLPDPALRKQALSSLDLVQAAQTRATALTSGIGCSCLSTADRDQLGPKPCTQCGTGATSPSPGSARTPGRTRHHTATSVVPGRTTAGGNSQGGAAVSTPGSSPATPPAASGSSGSKAPITLPGLLPTGTPSLPVSANSCGVSVSVPILGGVGVGLCNSVGVHVGK